MYTEDVQKYLDELAAHHDAPGEVDTEMVDPALRELAAALTRLEHPTLPAAVDSRFQAYLLLSSSLVEPVPVDEPEPVVVPAPAGINSLQTALNNFVRQLQTRFTPLQLAAVPVAALAFVFLCGGLLIAALLLNNSRMRTANVAAITGQVERFADGSWTALEAGDDVREGQRIRTYNDGTVTVRFFEGTETTFSANSEAVLTTVSGRLGGALQVAWLQLAGTTTHSVTPLSGSSAYYRLETPGGVVEVQGTSFSVAVQPNGRTQVSVLEGQVDMTGAGQTVSVQAGQGTVGGPGQAPEAPAYQFTGQGELTNIAGTTWTIGNLPVTVVSQTIIEGDPTIGDFVVVNGRVLDGNVWLADLIYITSPGASSFSMTAPLESIGPNFWQIGAVTVAVTDQTQLIGNLELGTLAQVTFTVLSDGTLVALVIEEVGGPLPTPTPGATLSTTVTRTPIATLTATASPTATATTTATATSIPTMTPVPPVIVDCYQVTFLGVEYLPNNTSTWSYHVAELPCAQDLSNWMVELPACVSPVSATPEPWEYVNPDSNFQLTGIKWEVGSGFTQGVFSVTLNGQWAVGSTQFGVKGPDVGIGITAGPSCNLPLPTMTPTGSVTPTDAATRPLTPTATISATATQVRPTATPVPPTQPPPPPPTQPPPPPTQPPPPPPPPGGNPLVITENDQSVVFTCNGNSVTVNGNSNTVTLLGSCGPITVKGNNNYVSYQSATSVTNTGNNNTIVQQP